MKRNFLTNAICALALAGSFSAVASDHDDGVTSLKPKSRNLTDVYAFREDNQTGMQYDQKNLILVMNSNPRSPAGVQRYFSTYATYDFHLTQLAGSEKDSAPTGRDDIVIRFRFSSPDNHGRQSFRVYVQRGKEQEEVSHTNFMTTSLHHSMHDRLTINSANIAGHRVDVFAGLREDPFFFDVDQFFKVRAGAAGLGPKVGFRSPETARDFTVGYNVNTIVMRIPLALLGGNSKPVLDVWETVTRINDSKQIERLARPAINEGLILTNAFLNAFNMIPPSADLTPPAAPVVAEAAASIDIFDGIDGKDDTTVAGVATAFLPDIMRIDTRKSMTVSTTAYNSDVSGSRGMLTGGRKLEDDVMDITISYLVAGDASGNSVKDNVSYAGTPGNSHQGHKLLYKQKTRKGAAFFPFLSRPD